MNAGDRQRLTPLRERGRRQAQDGAGRQQIARTAAARLVAHQSGPLAFGFPGSCDPVEMLRATL